MQETWDNAGMNVTPDDLFLFHGDGAIRATLRTIDWTVSPLGAAQDWPAELVTALDLALHARHPVLLLWGPRAVVFYNDACAALLGERHPAALGQPLRAAWPAAWARAGDAVHAALAGTATALPDASLDALCDCLCDAAGQGAGAPSAAAAAPVRGRSGAVLGIQVSFEAPRRADASPAERRLAFQLALADRLRDLSTPEEVVATASEMLGRELGVSRVLYCEIEDDGDTFFVRRDWAAPGIPSVAGIRQRLEEFGPEVAAGMRAGRQLVVPDVEADPQAAGHGASYAAIGVRAHVALPLLKAGRLRVAFAMHSPVPRPWQDGDVQLAQEVAERTWAAVQAVRAEAEARDAQARLSAVFDSLPVGVAVVDADGHYLMCNQDMQRFTPTRTMPSRDDGRIGRWRAWHEDGTPVARHDFPGARSLRGERVVPGIDMLYTEDDGSRHWTRVAAVPVRDADGNVKGLVSVVTDIDAMKRTEAALRVSQERYRALFDEMDAAFCIVELLFDEHGKPFDYRHIETNPRFEEHTGVKDAQGRTVKELLPNVEPFWLETYAGIVRSGESVRIEHYSPELGRWFDVNAFRLGRPDERLVAVMFRDTTARKQGEADMQRLAIGASEENRRKSEFLAVLAHELRNPLAPIRTGLELMRMRGDSPETVARVREMIDRQTTQMTHLISDLLDIARVTSGKIEIRKQAVDLNTIVSDAVETCLPAIEGARHALSVQLVPEPLALQADPTRIAQVVGNLLTNAAKYTPPGGRIRLSVTRDDGAALIAVTDSGIGIPAESLASVFDMFSQVGRNMGHSQGGLGIGLALVRQLVGLHGGTINVASEGAGRGSTFTVRLPLDSGAIPATWPAAARPAPVRSSRRLRILVADDNTDAAQSLAGLLGAYGHEVRMAHDGARAVELAESFLPEVAFLDIGMPGMTGYEVARRLRLIEGLARITIVAVTGWGTDEDRARSAQAGFDRHFTKPISPAAVNMLLDGVE
ncbi:PAS domain S-box protein [Massilia forsythiae]|uniref:histidine kinase n=1 Tax=Massilia forsythiae TaxID=2728020 RepID=A0A7Z2VUH4_9BURK|nr:ATP-binding protein [Massilia forsythiae]QJD99450.1 PAS domain S-box protein [Massilia forsythiae]